MRVNAGGNKRILYHKTNKEASTVLCSVVKHLGSGRSTQEVGRSSRLRLLFPPTLLSCSSRFLRTLQQNMMCNLTAVYKSFVNETAFFQATIDNFSLCYMFQALHRYFKRFHTTNIRREIIFSFLSEHFVLEPYTCNAFAPLCFHALGLYKHAQAKF